MTEVQEAAREGSSPGIAEPETSPESAQRAKSITPTALTASKAVTQRIQAGGKLLASGAALLDKPGSLVHSQPPTFRQARDRHHECAGHFNAPVLRYPRYIWGYFHLLVIKPALNLAEWITETPARFFPALIIAIVIWIWS